MAYLNIPEDQLSNIVATVLGQARAEIDVELRSRVDVFVNDFTERSSNDLLDSCPPINVLEGYIKQIDRIKSSINNIRRRISKITELRQRLSSVQRPLNVGVNVLLRLPIPSRFLTAGIQNTFSDTLNLLKELNNSLSSNVSLISSSTEAVNNQIDNLEQTINSVDALVQACIQSLQDGELSEEEERAIKELLKGVRGESDSAGDVTFPINYTASDGTPFVFEIQITEPDNVAPRRRAVAKDSFGVIRAIGEQSFSSSTEILVRELEFKIEQFVQQRSQSPTVSTVTAEDEIEINQRIQNIENVVNQRTANTDNLLTNNATSTPVGTGGGLIFSGSGSLTSLEQAWLTGSNSALADSLSNYSAVFTNHAFCSPPPGFASASLENGSFSVYVNGVAIPRSYISSIVEVSSNICVVFNSDCLAYTLSNSKDQVYMVGKFC